MSIVNESHKSVDKGVISKRIVAYVITATQSIAWMLLKPHIHFMMAQT